MEIVKEPNKILRKRPEPVKSITPTVKALISDMKETMKNAAGVGLAANQVGQDLQIFVIDENLARENKVPDTYVNPEITEYSRDKDVMEEGCLSLPDYWRQVKRSKKIKIKAIDENGQKVKFKARGFLARVLQHEVDHLNCLLISNR